MADWTSIDARRGQYDKRQRRRDKVVLISLVELLTIITFISVGMAFVTQQDVDLTRNWRLELEASQRENTNLRANLGEAQETIARQERELAILWDAYFGQPLPAEAELRREALETMRARGFGAPSCATPRALLLRVETYSSPDGSDALRAFAAWESDEGTSVAAIPAVAELINAGALSRDRFTEFATQIKIHGEQQPVQCRFIILLDEQHENLRLYKNQSRYLQRFFRVRASD